MPLLGQEERAPNYNMYTQEFDLHNETITSVDIDSNLSLNDNSSLSNSLSDNIDDDSSTSSSVDEDPILIQILNQLNNYKGLKIAHLNVRSLYPKIDEIRVVVISLHLDVMCISETWLNESISDGEIAIDGYSIVRKDRENQRGGGVCLYYKNTLCAINRNDIIVSFNIEALLLEIKCNKTNVLITCVYRPPSSGAEFYETLYSLLESLFMENKELIMLGDFNVDYTTSSSTNITLIESIFSLKQLITKPTRITMSSSTCIDLIFTSMPDNHIVTDVGEISLSDHYMIYTCVDCDTKNNTHRTVRCRDFNHFDNDAFIEEVRNCDILINIMHYFDENSISHNDIWLLWKQAFLNICDKYAPIKLIRVKSRYIPWITPDIIKLIHKRDYLKAKAKTTHLYLNNIKK